MKIQTKITLLLFLITLLFISGLLYVRAYEARREELVIKNKIYENNTLFDKFIRLESASLEMFVYDLSNRDEALRIVREKNRALAKASVDSLLPSFNIDAVWLYDSALSLIHAAGIAGPGGLEQVIPKKDFPLSLFSVSYFCHFFVNTPSGLMEIRSAPVQPSADAERSSMPRGYIFAGRLWSPAYMQELSLLTESTIEIVPIRGEETFESSYNQESGMITFSRVVYGWDKKPLMKIRVRSEAPVAREMHRAAIEQLILLVAFVSAVILLLSFLLIAWVNLPLKRISASLRAGNPGLLQKLLRSKTEFGNLAQLILKFFHQQEELKQEITDRIRAEDSLRIALQESQRSEAETSSLLKVSRAVLEHHEFQKASGTILAICMQLSRAAGGLIAEISGEELEEKVLMCTCAALPVSPERLPVMPLEGLYADAYHGAKPCYWNDVARFPENRTPPVGHLVIDNMLCAPLIIDSRVVALLVLANKEGGFQENDVRMASAFSELASVALFNSKTLASLEVSEERFRSVVETASDAIISVTSDDKIIFWNRGAELMFGYTPAEAVNNYASFLLPERYRDSFQQEARRLASDRITVPDLKPVEQVGLRKDGSLFPMEISQSSWKTKEGLFFTAIIRDITGRRKAEENLRGSEKRLRDIVENSLTGILITQEGRVVFKNREIDRLFGSIPESFSLHEADNIHPEDMEKVRTFYNDTITEAAQPRDVVFRFYPFGSADAADMRWVTCRGAVIEYQGKNALFINIMDITRIMELEQLVRIQEKMASLGRVAAGIAHEIRNPLTGVNSYLYSLNSLADSAGFASGERETLKKISDELQSASNKIEAVIRRVMDFSKPSMPKLTPIDINYVIEEALSLSAVMLRKSGVVVEKALGDNLPRCAADFAMIEQVLLNLLANAAQAMAGWAGDKKIQVCSRRADDAVAITISDSGPGIAPEHRGKIFDPFYTTKNDGAGIGLSLCQRIISDHHGTMTVGASRWGGAEFIIEIPLRKEYIPA